MGRLSPTAALARCGGRGVRVRGVLAAVPHRKTVANLVIVCENARAYNLTFRVTDKGDGGTSVASPPARALLWHVVPLPNLGDMHNCHEWRYVQLAHTPGVTKLVRCGSRVQQAESKVQEP
jgi:hypothetical protein